MLISLPGHAETLNGDSSTVTLNIDDCINKAVANSSALKKMDITMSGLYRISDSLEDSREAAESLLNSLDMYNSLYDKNQQYQGKLKEILGENGVDSIDEILDDKVKAEAKAALDSIMTESQLSSFGVMSKSYALFGITAPIRTMEEKFTRIVKPFEFSYYDMQAQIKNAEANREIMKANLIQSMRQTYDGILNLKDTKDTQQRYYDIQCSQHKKTLLDFENGQVSELDKNLSQVSLQQSSINLDILGRNIYNMEMNLKKQIGIEPLQKIELKLYDNQSKLNEPLTYDEYLSKALSARSEIATANKNIAIKNQEFSITQNYINDTSSKYFFEAQQAVFVENINLVDSIKNVTQDIKTGYIDITQKRSNIELAKQKSLNSESQYKEVLKKYEQGVISLTVLQNAESNNLQLKKAYQKSINDYNSALYRLDGACSIGPQYTAKAGAN